MVGLTLPQVSCCMAAGALFWLGCCYQPVRADTIQKTTEDPSRRREDDSCESASTAVSRMKESLA